MLATATHDTKRGEDHRTRLAVLSELADEWQALAFRWSGKYPAPEPAVGLMIWQTIVGAWPPSFDSADFHRRLEEWLVKALREAKQRTAWDDPDEGFERACKGYLAYLFDPNRGFLAEAEAFVDRIAPAGIRNSLAQTVLRLTVPGVPDLYQGAEFWDFSLVDPDNRRPVDFGARANALAEGADLAMLLGEWRDGRIKQALIARLLGFRRRHAALFAEGSYEPLAVSGTQAEHLVGFCRRHRGEVLAVLVPRMTAGLGAATGSVWRETQVAMPAAEGTDLLRPRKIQIGDQTDASLLLETLPLAVLYASAR
jgi:maltooligosyltrehalose synthase